MAYELKPGNGTLFKDKNFTQGGKYPYCSGRIMTPDGHEWDAALWIPKTEKVKGFNISIKEHQEYKKQDNAPATDGLPF